MYRSVYICMCVVSFCIGACVYLLGYVFICYKVTLSACMCVFTRVKFTVNNWLCITIAIAWVWLGSFVGRAGGIARYDDADANEGSGTVALAGEDDRTLEQLTDQLTWRPSGSQQSRRAGQKSDRFTDGRTRQLTKHRSRVRCCCCCRRRMASGGRWIFRPLQPAVD